jgi:perosamine synthetase
VNTRGSFQDNFLPILHNKVYAHEGDAEAVAKVINSGYWACGSEVESLERELSIYMGRKCGVCVSSGSAALRLALWAINVRENDEVIIPSYSCVALANSILFLGAIPVPSDIAYGTWVINLESVREKITKRTKAVIVVHTFGYPANIKKLLEIGIPIIEDCSHGFGALNGNILPVLGSEADVAITSLYATKFLGGGEGGFISLNDLECSLKLHRFRNYSEGEAHKLRVNDKMTDIEASLVRNRLRCLPCDLEWRRKLAHKYYNDLFPLQKLRYIVLPDISSKRLWYRFTFFTSDYPAAEIIEKLVQQGISADTPVENWLGCRIEKFPASKFAYNKLISLPFHAGINEQQVEYIVESIFNIFK